VGGGGGRGEGGQGRREERAAVREVQGDEKRGGERIGRLEDGGQDARLGVRGQPPRGLRPHVAGGRDRVQGEAGVFGGRLGAEGRRRGQPVLRAEVLPEARRSGLEGHRV